MDSWRRIALRWSTAALLCSGGLVVSLATGCASSRRVQRVDFPPSQIVGDLDLQKLNDEELYAAGTSAQAAGNFRAAARYFGRIADFFPQSQRRPSALLQAGIAHQKLSEWEDAYFRFSELADPAQGQGDALEASFRAAESLYHLDRFSQAAEVLATIEKREDLPAQKRLEARVQHAICLYEDGQADRAETMFRAVLSEYEGSVEKSSMDAYFPAQAQFFLGEIYRHHYERVVLDTDKPVEALSEDLEHKAQLLLSAQGHYLRAIRLGHGYWATAAGAQIGALYENLYEHMVSAPVPKVLNEEQAVIYREELRKKVRVLLSKAITVYEQTLEAAERIGSSGAFMERAKESLEKMKARLLLDVENDGPPDPESEAADTGSGIPPS